MPSALGDLPLTMQTIQEDAPPSNRGGSSAPRPSEARLAWRHVRSWPLLVTLLLYGAFLAARLALHGGDASLFVAAGDLFADAARVPPGLHVLAHSSGYDGQAYYRLALDPFTTKVIDHGIRLDNPPYRQQRILYPLLAWLLALGRPAATPWLLIGLNLVGLGAIAALFTALARSSGQPPWLGVLLGFYPGFVLSLAFDLTEVLEVACLLSGIVLLRRSRFTAAAVGLSLAVLARETAVLVPVSLSAVWAAAWLRGSRPRVPLWAFALPLATYVLWQGSLWLRWGVLPVRAGGGNFGPPFAGLLAVSRALGTPASASWGALWAAEMGFVLLIGAMAAVVWAGSRAPDWAKLAWLLYGALAACLAPLVWSGGWSLLRALSEWYLLASVLIAHSSRRSPLVCLVPPLALWALLAAELAVAPL